MDFDTAAIVTVIVAAGAAVLAIGAAVNSGPKLALAAVGWIGRVFSR